LTRRPRSVWYQFLKGLCHHNGVRVDQRHVHIHQVTYIERTTWQRRRKRQRRLQRRRRSPRRRAPKRRNNRHDLLRPLATVSAPQASWRAIVIVRPEFLLSERSGDKYRGLAPCTTGCAASNCCTWGVNKRRTLTPHRLPALTPHVMNIPVTIQGSCQYWPGSTFGADRGVKPCAE
jgi:hypothetical protein